jgi:hypothetical protein
MPITAEQIHQVFGSGQVKALRLEPETLPTKPVPQSRNCFLGIVDKLTPNGAVPAHNNVNGRWWPACFRAWAKPRKASAVVVARGCFQRGTPRECCYCNSPNTPTPVVVPT